MRKFSKIYFDKIYKEASSRQGTIRGTLDISNLYIKELPEFFKDLTVEGSFWVYRNQLTSCKNFPKVHSTTRAYGNNISSLEGLQTLPHEMFLNHNKIKSLEEFSKFDPDIDKINKLAFYKNDIDSLKGLERLTVNFLNVQRNNISSWEYLPKNLEYLYKGNNKLKSWKGVPSGLVQLDVGYNWDITNFNDYEWVDNVLWLSSSVFTSADVERLIKEKYPDKQYMPMIVIND